MTFPLRLVAALLAGSVLMPLGFLAGRALAAPHDGVLRGEGAAP